MKRDSLVDVLGGASILLALEVVLVLFLRSAWGSSLMPAAEALGKAWVPLVVISTLLLLLLALTLAGVLATRTLDSPGHAWRRLSAVVGMAAVGMLLLILFADAPASESRPWLTTISGLLFTSFAVYAVMWVPVHLMFRASGGSAHKAAPAPVLWRRPGVLLWATVVLVAVGLQMAALSNHADRPERVDLEQIAERVQEHIRYGEMDNALALAEEAATLAPDRWEAWWTLARAHGSRKEYGKAEEACRKALEFGPDVAELHYGLGHALYAQGKMPEAITSFNKAVELDPSDVEAYCYLGDALFAQGRYDEAARMYRTALGLKPEAPVILAGLARALIETGDAEEATALASKAVRQEPNRPALRRLNGNALSASGDWVRALGEFRVAVDLAPGDPAGHIELIEMLVMAGELSEARQAAQRLEVVAGERNAASALTTTAWVMSFQGETEEAVECLPRRVPPQGGHWVAAVLSYAGRWDEAVTVARRLAEDNPDSPSAHGLLASMLAYTEQWDEARHEAERSLELRPAGQTVTTAVCALALAHLGERETAREMLPSIDQALDRRDAWMDQLYPAGLAYRELGDTEKSNALFQRAIDRWPKHPWSVKMGEMMQESDSGGEGA